MIYRESEPIKLKQALFYLFLIAYVLLLAKTLLFKQISLFEFFRAGSEVSRVLNLAPFTTILEYTHFNIWIALMNVLGNVVLFVPMGLYLQIFKKNKRVLHSIAIVCAVSLGVEMIQYIFALGRTDIDDVILNVAGGLLGVWLYKLLCRLLKDEDRIRTAVTFLFLLVCAGAGTLYCILVFILGFRIKIF